MMLKRVAYCPLFACVEVQTFDLKSFIALFRLVRQNLSRVKYVAYM